MGGFGPSFGFGLRILGFVGFGVGIKVGFRVKRTSRTIGASDWGTHRQVG